jgi:hypothetical protein
MYDAQLGRFCNRDPIGYTAGDENLYRYVMNRPMNRVDASGQSDPCRRGYIWVGPELPPPSGPPPEHPPLRPYRRVGVPQLEFFKCYCNWRVWSIGFWAWSGCHRSVIHSIHRECCEDCCGRIWVVNSDTLNTCLNGCVPETGRAAGCIWIF